MTTAPTFDPTAIATIGHNKPPANDNEQSPFNLIKAEIEDLFETAKGFCDGEPIDSEELAATITELHDRIHAAGKKADELRVEEKQPLDDQIKAIQAKYAPLISDTKSVKGKVVLGKEACQSLLTPWRVKLAAAAQAEAARIAKEAEAARLTAQEAIRASSGNLAAREEAEELLANAKTLERQAGRAEKEATTGTRLRTVYRAELVDLEAALEWYYGERPEEFTALIQRLADSAVAAGVRKIPGFQIVEDKVATTGRVR